MPCGRGHERCGLCCACSVRPERYCSNPLVPSGVRCSWLAIDACTCLYTAPHAIWRGVRRYTPRRAALTLVPRCRRRGMADTDPWELHRITGMHGSIRMQARRLVKRRQSKIRLSPQGSATSREASAVHHAISSAHGHQDYCTSCMRGGIHNGEARSTLVYAPKVELVHREAHTTTQWVEEYSWEGGVE